jgi:hypothetical protein
MKSITVLKIASILLLIGCLGYTFLNLEELFYFPGWNVISIAGLFFFGFAGLVIDFLLVKLIKNKLWLNLVELLIVLWFSFELWIKINGHF